MGGIDTVKRVSAVVENYLERKLSDNYIILVDNITNYTSLPFTRFLLVFFPIVIMLMLLL